MQAMMRSHDAVPADVTSLLDNLDKVRVDNNRPCYESSSRIHERIILLRFLGIILRVLRLGIPPYTMFTITIRFQTTFAHCILHCKKGKRFSRPQPGGMSLTFLFLVGSNQNRLPFFYRILYLLLTYFLLSQHYIHSL